MTQKIIALVDGSLYSQSVCAHAAWLSRRCKAPVELLHVLGRREAPQVQDLSGAIRLGARSKLMEELAELDAQRAKLSAQRGRAILEDGVAVLEQSGTPFEVTSRLRHGDLVETIAEIEAGAHLLVIGKRGEAADFAKGHLGSNLERIVRTARLPVFVAARAFKEIKSVLIAYDGGPSALKATEHIAQSPLFEGLGLTLVTVGAPSPEVSEGLERAKRQLQSAGRKVEARILSGAAPESALGDLVEGGGFDMLVMGAYGHSRIRTMVIGSTTTEMLRSCKVPVMLVR